MTNTLCLYFSDYINWEFYDLFSNLCFNFYHTNFPCVTLDSIFKNIGFGILFSGMADFINYLNNFCTVTFNTVADLYMPIINVINYLYNSFNFDWITYLYTSIINFINNLGFHFSINFFIYLYSYEIYIIYPSPFMHKDKYYVYSLQIRYIRYFITICNIIYNIITQDLFDTIAYAILLIFTASCLFMLINGEYIMLLNFLISICWFSIVIFCLYLRYWNFLCLVWFFHFSDIKKFFAFYIIKYWPLSIAIIIIVTYLNLSSNCVLLDPTDIEETKKTLLDIYLSRIENISIEKNKLIDALDTWDKYQKVLNSSGIEAFNKYQIGNIHQDMLNYYNSLHSMQSYNMDTGNDLVTSITNKYIIIIDINQIHWTTMQAKLFTINESLNLTSQYMRLVGLDSEWYTQQSWNLHEAQVPTPGDLDSQALQEKKIEINSRLQDVNEYLKKDKGDDGSFWDKIKSYLQYKNRLHVFPRGRYQGNVPIPLTGLISSVDSTSSTIKKWEYLNPVSNANFRSNSNSDSETNRSIHDYLCRTNTLSEDKSLRITEWLNSIPEPSQLLDPNI